MRQQFVDATVLVRRQPLQHIPQVGPRIVSVELGRLHQAHHHGRALPRQLAAGEQPSLPSNGPRTNLVLEMVVVQRNLAIEQEATELRPAPEAVVNRPGRGATVGYARSLELKPL